MPALQFDRTTTITIADMTIWIEQAARNGSRADGAQAQVPAGGQATFDAAWQTATADDGGAPQAAAPLVPPLVPHERLARADKILFIAPLAIGDFTYLQCCFQAFARAYPHIRLHLWVDERRRTRRAAAWPHLKNYALYDWLDSCSCFDKVYKQTYSPALLRASVREAQDERYPIVVSLGVLERHKYAALARRISPGGFVVGQKKRVRFYDIVKRLVYRKLDASIPAYTPSPDRHISDIYAGWFAQLFGLAIARADRFPVLDIPEVWTSYARGRFAAWGFTAGPERQDEVVFLNGYAKSAERSWPLARVIELVRAMQGLPRWRNAGFVVNVVPEDLERARAVFAGQDLPRTHLFSAEENFFQLPAVLALCTLIVSVETSVMHLANAVNVPVIALMRQKNPEWAPVDKANSTVLTVPGRDDWVERIGVDDVLAALPRAALPIPLSNPLPIPESRPAAPRAAAGR
jgi:heptosyltransferase-3